MNYLDFFDVKGDYTIIHNDAYIIFFGPQLWVYTIDKQYVVHRKDIANVYKAVFLPGDKVLVDAGKKGYMIISLIDGVTLHSFPQKVYETKAKKFVVSSDGTWVYDYYDWKERIYFVKINLKECTLEEYVVGHGLQATKDISCDENGIPCLLQTQYTNISGTQFSENGILIQYQDDISPGNTFYWKQKWSFEGKRISMLFFGSVENVITNDLYVYNMKSGEIYFLLENEHNVQVPNTPIFFCSFDYSGKYVFLVYDCFSYVVDIKKRKIIFYHAGRYSLGCIAKNEYLVSSEEGIQCIPLNIDG